MIVVSDGPDEDETESETFEITRYYGWSLSDATIDLKSKGLILKSAEPRDTKMEKDKVVDQLPLEGTLVSKGDEVTLYYSSGKRPESSTQNNNPTDEKDPDEAIGTGSVVVALPPQPGEAKVEIQMSGNIIHSNFYSTSTGTVTINGLQGSIGTHDVSITVTGPDGGVQNYENTITFS